MTSDDTQRSARDDDANSEARAESTSDASATAGRMEAISKLAGVVSHDFSNLLTVILGHADMLLDVSSENPAVRNSVLEIKNAAESGARVTADLLAISQRQPLQPAPVDVNVIVRNMAETLCQILGEQIDVRFDLALELPLVEVDAVQYERVLRSIAVHAREVMPSGGRLTFATMIERHATRTNVVLRASDTAAAAAPRSTEPIFTGKKPSRGAGLALTTAHGIVNQSGGSMSVTQPSGRGATITVVLPARDASRYLHRT